MSNVIHEIYKDGVRQGTVCKYEGHYLESFNQLIRVYEITDKDVDQISIRYAKEQTRELVEILEQCEQLIVNCNQYAPILKVIEQLINKHKGGN